MEKKVMKKYYAIITKKDGSQFTIGGYSEREIQKDLKDIHKSGFANLDEASVEIYSINI